MNAILARANFFRLLGLLILAAITTEFGLYYFHWGRLPELTIFAVLLAVISYLAYQIVQNLARRIG